MPLELVIASIFILGYAIFVPFENKLRINKSGPVLVMAMLCWSIYAIWVGEKHVKPEMNHHLAEVASIVFFLWGALSIVELVSAYNGFDVITKRLRTDNEHKLLWRACLTTFFMAAIIDNVTATVVMFYMLKDILKNDEKLKFMAGMAIVSANAGGTWSPLGEVTSTMLWAGGQVDIAHLVLKMFIPSLIHILVPLFILSLRKNTTLELQTIVKVRGNTNINIDPRHTQIMTAVGIGALLFVPIFKTVTHLPPYAGMVLAWGVVWFVSEILNNKMDTETRKELSVASAVQKVEQSSLWFFFGILLAVGCLQSIGILAVVGKWLEQNINSMEIVLFIIGLASAIVDNVPLVAAVQGMYQLTEFPTNHFVWIYLSYCAGTGGSILIIGSAAGVAVQERANIHFGWFARKIGWLALIGYTAGAIAYLLLNHYVYPHTINLFLN